MSVPIFALLSAASAAGLSATSVAGLSLRDAHPVRVREGGPGAPPVYRFSHTELAVLPGVVLTIAPGAAPPSGARHVGGPSFLLPAPDGDAAVQMALRLQDQAGVLRAWPDVILPLRPAFDDPSYGGQWYLDDLEMEALYAVSMGDPGTRVAVIDSGIDISHADLVDAYDAPYDAWSDDDDPSPDPGEYCHSAGQTDTICDQHGTAVSGVVLARADNGAGIVGMCPTCTLIPIKLLGEGAGNTLSADIAAFEHAIAQDVAVINNSWGFTAVIQVPDALAEVIARAATEPRGGLGALVVFAAGNDDRELEPQELTALDDVFCVSATDSYGYPTNYTNSGDAVDVAAPSATVSIAPGDETLINFGGTSAAAPVVSGLAAWAVSVDPTLSAVELADLLITTAVPSPLVTHDEDGHHPEYGYGELSAIGVLDALTSAGTTADTGGSTTSGGTTGGSTTGGTGSVADSGAPDSSGNPGESPVACGCSAAPPPWGPLALLGALGLRRRR